MDRALHCVYNVGIEPLSVAARALHGVDNIGIEPLVVTARALHGVDNIGIEPLTVTARALHGLWNVSLFTSLQDPVEFRLLGFNLLTVEAILRGK